MSARPYTKITCLLLLYHLPTSPYYRTSYHSCTYLQHLSHGLLAFFFFPNCLVAPYPYCRKPNASRHGRAPSLCIEVQFQDGIQESTRLLTYLPTTATMRTHTGYTCGSVRHRDRNTYDSQTRWQYLHVLLRYVVGTYMHAYRSLREWAENFILNVLHQLELWEGRKPECDKNQP